MLILHVVCTPDSGKVALKVFKREFASVAVNYAESLQHE